MTDPKPEGAWYSRPWFLISGAFLVLLIIVSVLILALVPSPNGKSASQGAGQNPDTAQPPANAGESVCGLPAGSQDVPQTEAPTTTWDQLTIGDTDVTVPWSPNKYGPARVNSQTGAPICYAHSPTGALYAAGAMGSLAGARELKAASELVIPGPGAEAMQKWSGAEGVAVNLVGYQYLSYTDDVAVISLAFSGSNGALVSWPMTLQWLDGDWRVQIADDGISPASRLESLTGFVGWSGAL